MQIDERDRREMYERLEKVLGARTADTLMEHLPPVGWADVATNAALDQLADRLTAQLHREITRMIMWFVPTMLSGVGLAFAAARFS